MIKENRPTRTDTLCVIHQQSRVLLGLKKRGFGKDKWNGFGGKIEKGESLEESLRREVYEEAGILLKDPHHVGILTFFIEEHPEIIEVHVFRAEKFKGSPRESEEMIPRWFKIEEIPYDQMWEDDRLWFPLLLARKKFQGSFHFDQQQCMQQHRLTCIN